MTDPGKAATAPIAARLNVESRRGIRVALEPGAGSPLPPARQGLSFLSAGAGPAARGMVPGADLAAALPEAPRR